MYGFNPIHRDRQISVCLCKYPLWVDGPHVAQGQPQFHFTQECWTGQCQAIQGRHDTQYDRSVARVIVILPDGCKYWLDEDRLVVLDKGKLCPECHSLLEEFEGGRMCNTCLLIWEK